MRAHCSVFLFGYHWSHHYHFDNFILCLCLALFLNDPKLCFPIVFQESNGKVIINLRKVGCMTDQEKEQRGPSGEASKASCGETDELVLAEPVSAESKESLPEVKKEEVPLHKVKAEKTIEQKKTSKKKTRKKRSKISLPVIIVIVVIIIALIAILPGLVNCGNKGQTISNTTLKQALNISKLSTAELTYEGIADKVDDRGNPVYYVYYKATVDSGIDFDQINFRISDSEKTITPILPEITIGDPVIDESAIEFMPSDANAELRDVIEICKQDAANEIKDHSRFKETSLRNLHSTIEALLVPLLKGTGYSIVWDDVIDSLEANNEDQIEDSAIGEGGNDESHQ